MQQTIDIENKILNFNFTLKSGISGLEYQFIEQIGEGSEGQVYKARVKTTKEIVAIKSSNIQSQNKEIQQLNKCKFQHVLNMWEIIVYNQNVYTVMDYADGEFHKFMKTQEYLGKSKDEKNQLFQQIVKGVEEIHQLNFIHRDIKPENVLYFKQENGDILLKLCDFGLLKNSADFRKTPNIGTPYYWAPEIITDNQTTFYTNQVDIWALGMLWYEMLTGRNMFHTFLTVDSLRSHIKNLTQQEINNNIDICQQFEDYEKDLLKKKILLVKNMQNQRISASQLIQQLQWSFDQKQIKESQKKNEQTFEQLGQRIRVLEEQKIDPLLLKNFVQIQDLQKQEIISDIKQKQEQLQNDQKLLNQLLEDQKQELFNYGSQQQNKQNDFQSEVQVQQEKIEILQNQLMAIKAEIQRIYQHDTQISQLQQALDELKEQQRVIQKQKNENEQREQNLLTSSKDILELQKEYLTIKIQNLEKKGKYVDRSMQITKLNEQQCKIKHMIEEFQEVIKNPLNIEMSKFHYLAFLDQVKIFTKEILNLKIQKDQLRQHDQQYSNFDLQILLTLKEAINKNQPTIQFQKQYNLIFDKDFNKQTQICQQLQSKLDQVEVKNILPLDLKISEFVTKIQELDKFISQSLGENLSNQVRKQQNESARTNEDQQGLKKVSGSGQTFGKQQNQQETNKSEKNQDQTRQKNSKKEFQQNDS